MRSPEEGRITWGSRCCVAQGKDSGKVCHRRIYKYIPALVLRLFALIPLATLHYFLISVHSFSI